MPQIVSDEELEDFEADFPPREDDPFKDTVQKPSWQAIENLIYSLKVERLRSEYRQLCWDIKVKFPLLTSSWTWDPSKECVAYQRRRDEVAAQLIALGIDKGSF